MTSQTLTQAGLAFDTLAEDYDASFTDSTIGRAQRNVVWRKATEVFPTPQHILELNCGTGEDALFLASQGHSITALDASTAMVARASARKLHEAPTAPITFTHLLTEHLYTLPATKFDAVFSNFSGLNCVADLREVAVQLALRTTPNASLLFCVSTPVCAWETAWFLLQGKLRKATRRWPGHSTATLKGIPVTVHYPTVRTIAGHFAPHFTLRSSTGVGIFVPPSYLEPWMKFHPRLLAALTRIDKAICRLPIMRNQGDHVLLHFVRNEASA
jgi:SAM-dependent methyltransferase